MGGHLLGAKVTEDVSRVRGVPVGSDALSPCRYYDVQTLDDMKHMVAFLRDVTNYQVPILFKLGPSRPYADVAACIEAGADAISIDGMVGAPVAHQISSPRVWASQPLHAFHRLYRPSRIMVCIVRSNSSP